MQTLPDPVREQIVARLLTLVLAPGMHPTAVDGVTLMRADQSMPRVPVLQEPTLVILAQGQKKGYLGDQVFTYDASQYLVVSVPLHFECETTVQAGEPMLALSVRVDAAVLGDLMLRMDSHDRLEPSAEVGAMFASPMDGHVADVALRLLHALGDPMDAQVLGPALVRELMYRALTGAQGATLRSLFGSRGRLGRIQRSIDRMQADLRGALDIASLAQEAGMSVSAFHHRFKALTGSSPVQYIKCTRLHRARQIMVQEGLTAGAAAYQVGYASESQFSREFKRLFGATPAAEAQRLRQSLSEGQALH